MFGFNFKSISVETKSEKIGYFVWSLQFSWTFFKTDEGGKENPKCLLTFWIDFELKSIFLQRPKISLLNLSFIFIWTWNLSTSFDNIIWNKVTMKSTYDQFLTFKNVFWHWNCYRCKKKSKQHLTLNFPHRKHHPIFLYVYQNAISCKPIYDDQNLGFTRWENINQIKNPRFFVSHPYTKQLM